MTWFSGNWSERYFVTEQGDARWNVNCRMAPGVYRLIALKQPGLLDPEPLNRVCGTDETGTIYIGQSDNLQYRVSALVREHNPYFKTGSHTALPVRLKAAFPPDRLAVCWEFVADDVLPRERETNLLNAYQNEFGELPPLNFQG